MGLLSSSAYRIHQGETIFVQVFSSVVMTLAGRFRLVYDDGDEDEVILPDFTTGSARAAEYVPLREVARKNGYVVTGVVDISGATAVQPNRGQTYVRFFISAAQTATPVARDVMAEAYLYRAFGVTLGMHIEPGPGGGEGRLYWAQEANDIAGNVVTTVNLAAATTRRMIRAIIVKYHQVGGADATITLTLRDLADSGGPTNWSIESDTWVSPSLVLAANQEGLIHVGEHGFVATNDAGTIAYADNTTAPNPFPFMVASGETVDLIIAASGGASGDDYDVWVQYEEWFSG